ncbi:MAG: ATP-binding cassette domain-containing protein [Emergencia timonensis]|uniref:ABC transporter ATP-binding protein n=1 Tax=Emergencia timonensis TaxID=1776384 RepID=UPI00082DAC13|nr:ABC transporter ATP-binding protein [Emergencia timonensis]WNX90426.1 ABC transporter ATP-binding protein [Emergencia timonensis]
MEEILRFENVTIGYNEKDIIKDFSCTVKRGEFVSLIGPNGSGKSTLIHAITGIVGIRKGKIYINGKDNEKLSAKERAQITAVVPQTFQASFAFKAKEIVAMGRHPFLKRMQSETEEDYKLIDQALEQTGTLHLRERKITQLSGGERQRIIISAALAQQPQLLIVDEPTNHLDIQYTLEVMQLMQKLNREQGITIFAVLHDINMAARFSDRILVLNEGQKVRDGKVSEVIREEVLKPVYKIDLVVRENPLTGASEIVPLRSNKSAQRKSNGKRVHIICGGGSGSYIIEAFHNKGYEVSCGVLNVGDSDYELCRSLGIKTIAEKPYCEISGEAFDENLLAIESADLVVLTDVDIGRSNLKNIEILEHLSSQNLYIVRENASDYTGGIGDKIINSLLAEKKAISLTKKELIEILNKY